MVFSTIEEALEDIVNGKMIVVVDDENRENEGDIVMAAQLVTPEAVNFMITHGKGLVCLPINEQIATKLELKEMVKDNSEAMRTAFTVSIDGHEKYDISTGISPKDRAKTIQLTINPKSSKNDLVTPGHIFPLLAQKGGVLKRAGHTEAAVDLAKMANLIEAGVICEIIKENGEMARVPDLITFAKKHNLKIITIANLIKYRVAKDQFVRKEVITDLPTKQGVFKAIGYLDTISGKEHVALVKGDVRNKEDVLVRIHSECLTGDVFRSARCDCGDQLAYALDLIAKEGCGVVLYLRQEGRGIGLINKLKAYDLQDKGRDTVEANLELGFEADLRDYGVGAQILHDLELSSIRIITNNPQKMIALEGYGLQIRKRVSIKIKPNKHNHYYLKTKQDKLGHILNI